MTITLRLLPLLTAFSLGLFAAEPTEVHWNDLCRAVHGRQVVITTANQGVVEGYCVAISVEEVSLRTENGRLVKVARNALSRVQMHRAPRGRQLNALGKGVGRGLHDGVGLVFSPLAPVGLVMVPGALAWGLVAAPFCIVGDLLDHAAGKQEYRVI